MFYFCPYPPSTQARYDLLQVQYLPPSQWFQPVARAYTFLTTHTHAYVHAHMYTPQRTRQRPPFFSKAAAHTDLSAAKPPPCCVEKEQRRQQEYLQEDRSRRSSSSRAGGGSVRWAGVRNTADGGGQAACLFCVLDRTAISLRVSTHTHTHTHMHTHIVTPVTRQRGQPPPPEVGPIKSYMQVRWRGETRSCKATRISFLIFHRPASMNEPPA